MADWKRNDEVSSEPLHGDFIKPGINIADVNSAAWKQMANLSKSRLRDRWLEGYGRGVMNEILKAEFDRQAIAGQVGRFDNRIDLRGAPISGKSVLSKDLHNIDFFHADLSGSDFSRSNLNGSSLSEANIRRAKFDWCRMERVTVDSAEYNSDTSLTGVNLNSMNFTLAALLHEHALTEQRIDHLKVRNPWLSQFLAITSDYGRSFRRYSLWVVFIILFYSIIYWKFKLLDPKPDFLDSFYFSILTFSTVGYGDIKPACAVAKMVAVSEIGIGYLMGGLLIAILSRRVVS